MIIPYNYVFGQIVDTSLWSPNGSIYDLEVFDDQLFIGGDFSAIGPYTGSLVVFDSNESFRPEGVDKFQANIHLIKSDDKGGFYLSGDLPHYFESRSTNKLLHFNSDLEIDSLFRYSPYKPHRYILNIAIAEDSIYVLYSSSDSDYYIDVVSINTGQGRNLFRNLAFSSALCIKDSLLFFEDDKGLSAYNIKSDKKVPLINPFSIYKDSSPKGIRDITVSDKYLFVGGYFGNVTGKGGKHFASYNLSDLTLREWIPAADEFVSDLFYHEGALYAGGDFSSIDGVSRNGLASIDPESGALNSWDPNIDTQISSSFCEYGDSIIVATTRKLYRVDKYKGDYFDFGVNTSDNIDGIVNTGSSLVVAGNFSSIFSIERNNLASIDLNTGKPNSWNPSANGPVHALEIAKGRIIVGGEFTKLGDESIDGLASLNVESGLPDSWRPNTYGGVRKIAIYKDSILFIGGSFVKINSNPRIKLASFDLSSSVKLTDWNPGVNGYVGALEVGNKHLFIGGGFDQIGNVLRKNLAAYDIGQNKISPWNPNPDLSIYDVKFASGKIVVLGTFRTISAIPRNKLAIINENNFQVDNFKISKDFKVQSDFFWDGTNIFIRAFNDKTNSGNILKLNSEDQNVEYIYPSYFNFARYGMFRNRLIIGGHFNSVSDNPISNLYSIEDISFNSSISGIVFRNSLTCDSISGEGFKNAMVLVKGKNGNFYSSTDEDGSYSVKVDSGSYTVNQIIPQNVKNIFNPLCYSEVGYSVEIESSESITNMDFHNEVLDCSILNIDVISDRQRACFLNGIVVSVCNQGSIPVENIKLNVVLPPIAKAIESTLPWDFYEDSLLQFTIPEIDPLGCYNISISDSIICNLSNVNSTVCIKANIGQYDNKCYDEISHPKLELKGWTENNFGRFSIKNSNRFPLQDSCIIRLYDNDTLVYNGKGFLKEKDSLIINYPNTTSTLKLYLEYQFVEDVIEKGLEIIENDNSGKYSNTSYYEDISEDYEVFCLNVSYSFDPNDKKVSPVGIGNEGYIKNEDILEYVIRFQNTGSDTAYRVVIVDTLDASVDLESFEQGEVSHNYKLELSGKDRPILKWIFENINLPDSLTNPMKSNGYVKFSVGLKPEIANGTEIFNKASIFFDINYPIETNATMNTVWENTFVDQNKSSLVSFGNVLLSKNDENFDYQVVVFPNPVDEKSVLKINNIGKEYWTELELISPAGTLISKAEFKGAVFPLKKIISGYHGIFYLKAKSNDKVIVKKILIN